MNWKREDKSWDITKCCVARSALREGYSNQRWWPVNTKMCPPNKTTRKQTWWVGGNTIAFSSLLLTEFCQGLGCVLEWRSKREGTRKMRQLLTCPPGNDEQEPSLVTNPRWITGSYRSPEPPELLVLLFYSLTPSHPMQHLSSLQWSSSSPRWA